MGAHPDAPDREVWINPLAVAYFEPTTGGTQIVLLTTEDGKAVSFLVKQPANEVAAMLKVY